MGALPFIPLSKEIIPCTVQGGVQLLASFLVMVKAVSKHPVVDESGTAEGLGKHNLLFGCRVEPITFSRNYLISPTDGCF